ncbi:Leucine-rich_repeat domain superfamily [Hexamita inflata]|uniref:Leucine-rich repeat domain superfamily n=1 Tax=Hexamita inflata TaxID=28002 RepID=A0AA86QJV6_9EUKA|nr:Leucine-rich repeat domain superfamily [Hexamita inflata]
MQPNHAIRSKEDLLNHFGSSQKLEKYDSEQMNNLLALNVPPEVWENALNWNLLSFSQEFVQRTNELGVHSRKIKYIYLISSLTNLTELSLQNNNISDISAFPSSKTFKNSNYKVIVSKIFPHFFLLLIQLTLIYNEINQLPTQQLYRIQQYYLYSVITSYKINLGYIILQNQSIQICLKQKPQIYVLFLINYSV